MEYFLNTYFSRFEVIDKRHHETVDRYVIATRSNRKKAAWNLCKYRSNCGADLARGDLDLVDIGFNVTK